MISLIAAVDTHFLIGSNNTLPWGRLPADLAYFKEKTIGKTVVMGRKTYESIGKPLPDRTNIILTKDTDFKAPGCTIVHSVEELLSKKISDELMIIGGAQIFTTFLPFADRLYLTFIDGTFSGDVHFPHIQFNEWKKTSEIKKEADMKNPYQLTFSIFDRIKS